jgi:hypothetical protein
MADMICHKVYELLMSILNIFKKMPKIPAALPCFKSAKLRNDVTNDVTTNDVTTWVFV